MQQVVALDMIRDALRDAGVMVGPITLFAYKNHALDEIVPPLPPYRPPYLPLRPAPSRSPAPQLPHKP